MLYWIIANLNFNKLKYKEYFKHRLWFEGLNREKFNQASKSYFCCLCFLGYHLTSLPCSLLHLPFPHQSLPMDNCGLITKQELTDTETNATCSWSAPGQGPLNLCYYMNYWMFLNFKNKLVIFRKLTGKTFLFDWEEPNLRDCRFLTLRVRVK